MSARHVTPLPKKPKAVFHHPMGFELYDGLSMDLHAMKYAESVMSQRDALLDALTNIQRLFSKKCSASCITQADLQAIEESRAAIAKATGAPS